MVFSWGVSEKQFTSTAKATRIFKAVFHLAFMIASLGTLRQPVKTGTPETIFLLLLTNARNRAREDLPINSSSVKTTQEVKT